MPAPSTPEDAERQPDAPPSLQQPDRFSDASSEGAENAARDAATNKAPSPNTLRAYASDWRHFTGWCRRNGHPLLPADVHVVSLYIEELISPERPSGDKMVTRRTVERRLSAIAWNYRQRGTRLDRTAPQIKSVLANAGEKPANKRAGKIQVDELLAMLETLDRGALRGLRDRAILLLGFAGGLRRAELAGLDCVKDNTGDATGWIDIREQGMLVFLKTRAQIKEIEIGRGSSEATCPVAALETWLKFARITRGPVFRRVIGKGRTVDVTRLNDRHITRLVEHAALQAGLNAGRSAQGREEHFSSRSLSSGLRAALMTSGTSSKKTRFQLNMTKAIGL